MNVALTVGYLMLYLSGLMMGVAYLSHMVRTMLDSTDMGQRARALYPTVFSSSYSWWCLFVGVTIFAVALISISIGT